MTTVLIFCYTVRVKRKMFWCDQVDEQAIATIRARYGTESASQAIRLALRVLAESARLDVVLPDRPPHARRSAQQAMDCAPRS